MNSVFNEPGVIGFYRQQRRINGKIFYSLGTQFAAIGVKIERYFNKVTVTWELHDNEKIVKKHE